MWIWCPQVSPIRAQPSRIWCFPINFTQSTTQALPAFSPVFNSLTIFLQWVRHPLEFQLCLCRPQRLRPIAPSLGKFKRKRNKVRCKLWIWCLMMKSQFNPKNPVKTEILPVTVSTMNIMDNLLLPWSCTPSLKTGVTKNLQRQSLSLRKLRPTSKMKNPRRLPNTSI